MSPPPLGTYTRTAFGSPFPGSRSSPRPPQPADYIDVGAGTESRLNPAVPTHTSLCGEVPSTHPSLSPTSSRLQHQKPNKAISRSSGSYSTLGKAISTHSSPPARLYRKLNFGRKEAPSSFLRSRPAAGSTCAKSIQRIPQSNQFLSSTFSSSRFWGFLRDIASPSSRLEDRVLSSLFSPSLFLSPLPPPPTRLLTMPDYRHMRSASLNTPNSGSHSPAAAPRFEGPRSPPSAFCLITSSSQL